MHKLLLADDSVTIQRVIELTFSGEDIQVIAVNDGEQAIARIPIEHPDIVLADIGMPKRSGYEVAAFVKGHPELANIPVVLLAGAFERVDEARAEQVGCDGVLVKPFEPRQVVARVRELIASASARLSTRADAARAEEHAITTSAADVASTAPETPASVSEPQAELQSEPAATPASALESSFLDPSLDDYFEKLNSALEEAEDKPSSEPVESAGPAPAGRRPDSLDGYFDRLSAAFADLAKPLRESDTPPPSFDEIMTDRMPPAPAPAPREAESRPAEAWTAASNVGSLDLPAYPPPAVAASALPDVTPTPILPPEPPETSQVLAADRRDGAPEEDIDGIADVLTALLKEPSTHFDEPDQPLTAQGSVSAPATDREALVDEVARRVLERLVPEVTASLRRLVADELQKIGAR